MRGLVLTGNPGIVGMLPPEALSGGLVLTGQNKMASGFSGPCPAPSKQSKNGGCCLSAAQHYKNRGACCGPKLKTVVVKQPGGKFSLACKPLGGPGPTPGGDGDVTAGEAIIKAVAGNTVTLNRAIGAINGKNGSCGGSKPNTEMRRPNVPGLGEFVGTVTNRSGNVYSLDTGMLAGKSGYMPPRVGEKVILYCANGGGAGGDGSDFMESGMLGGFGEGFSTLTSSPLFMPAVLIIGGLILYKMVSQPSYAPARRR